MNAPPRYPSRPPASEGEVLRWRRRVRLAGAASALWLLSWLSIVLVAVLERADPTAAAGWLIQTVITGVATVYLWRWWRRIHDDRPSQLVRPAELDEQARGHIGLGGDVEPPTRW